MISNKTIVFSMAFQNCCPKHPNKDFFFLNLKIFIFVQNFAFRKFENDFNCDYTFFKFHPKILK